MANTDKPYGFLPVNPGSKVIKSLGGGAFKKGDPVILSSGKYIVATTTSTALAGIAAEDCAGNNYACYIWADPEEMFHAQCNGTYARATHAGNNYDLTGSTGIFEINESATTYEVIHIYDAVPDSTVAEYCRVVCKIAKHTHSSISATATTLASVTCTNGMTVGTTLAVAGATTLGATLAVAGNTTVGGTLGVTGAATFSSTINTQAATLLSLACTNNATVGGTLSITGATTAAAITASGNVSAGGTLGCTGAFTAGTTAAISGNTTVGGTLGVTGNSTLGGTLGVTGATTLSSTLNAGASTLASLTCSGAASVGATLGVTGNTTLGGTCAITGNTTVGGTFGVTGAVTMSASATVGGTLGVTGVTTTTGGLVLGTDITAGAALISANAGQNVTRGNTGPGAAALDGKEWLEITTPGGARFIELFGIA
jgi:hypothetical protein